MECSSPIQVSRPDGFKQLVPCGHCLNCSIRRQMAWTLRICLEASSHEFSSFLTLTYAEDMRPGSLRYEHIQQFLRRLRKNTPQPVRFFCVGEFGKSSEREHWHLILFNSPFLGMGLQHIEQWPYGGCFIGEVNQTSAAYVARYSLKTGPKGGGHVMQCSRKPGIGLDRIRQISSWMVSQRPELDRVPSWWRIGARMYPLDKSARTAFLASYKQAGGVVLHEGKSRMAMDLEAKLTAIVGDPFGRLSSEALQIRRLDREELSRGKL